MDLARRAFDPFDLLNMPALTNFSGLSMEQGQKMFASSEGTFRLLFVQARPDLASYRSCSSWLKSVQAAVDDLRAQRARLERRRGPLHRAPGLCDGNRRQHAARPERFGRSEPPPSSPCCSG